MESETRKEVGKYFIDISKLIFGGVVLASIIKVDEINRILILFVGLGVTILSAVVGFIIFRKNK